MVRLLIEPLGRVPVKDRAAERRPRHRIAITTPSTMPPREHKLELARPGLPKQRDRRGPKPFLAAVVLDLLEDRLRILRTMQSQENLPYHRLLVGIEEPGDRLLRNVPVVVDLRAQRMVEWKANRLALFFAEGFPEGSHQRLGLVRIGRHLPGLRRTNHW